MKPKEDLKQLSPCEAQERGGKENRDILAALCHRIWSGKVCDSHVLIHISSEMLSKHVASCHVAAHTNTSTRASDSDANV